MDEKIGKLLFEAGIHRPGTKVIVERNGEGAYGTIRTTCIRVNQTEVSATYEVTLEDDDSVVEDVEHSEISADAKAQA